MDRLIEGIILSYYTHLYLKGYGQAHQKSLILAENPQFFLDNVRNWRVDPLPKKKICSGMDRLIEGIILSYHTPLYLKGYGHTH